MNVKISDWQKVHNMHIRVACVRLSFSPCFSKKMRMAQPQFDVLMPRQIDRCWLQVMLSGDFVFGPIEIKKVKSRVSNSITPDTGDYPPE